MKRETLGRDTIDYYILPNKILCSIVGLWPIEEKSTRLTKYFVYFRLLFSLTAVTSMVVPEILAIIMNWGDIDVLTGVGCVTMTVSQLLFKMIYLLARREKSLKLYDEMRKCWYISNDPNARKGCKDLASKARMLTISLFCMGTSNVTTFTIAATVIWIKDSHSKGNETEANYHLPFEVWYGPNPLDPLVFEIAFICQIVASMVCVAGIVALDCSMMTLIVHTCGQFKTIQAWFGNIGKNIGESLNIDNALSGKVKRDIKRSIEHHRRIIIMVKETNDLLSPIIFVQFFSSGLEICLSGYAVTYGARGYDLVKSISYLTSMMVQLWIWCWPAELLIQESMKVADSVYFDIPWYDLPVSYRKDLCLVIIRAQKYNCVSTPIFNDLSMRTLTNVFNTAASYFTLLQQI